jgi:hypothetical protein
MALAACGAMPVGLGAGTLEGSLILAYENNPQLNSQHAAECASVCKHPRVGRTSSSCEFLSLIAERPCSLSRAVNR